MQPFSFFKKESLAKQLRIAYYNVCKMLGLLILLVFLVAILSNLVASKKI